jgi:hypothetical protein
VVGAGPRSRRTDTELVVGWMPSAISRRWSLADDSPALAPAILYADRVTVLCPQSDDALERGGYFSLQKAFPETVEFRALDSLYAVRDASGKVVIDASGNYSFGPLVPEIWGELFNSYLQQAIEAASSNEIVTTSRVVAAMSHLVRDDDLALETFAGSLTPLDPEMVMRVKETLSTVRASVSEEVVSELLAAVFLHQAQLPGRYAVIDDVEGTMRSAIQSLQRADVGEWADVRGVEAALGVGLLTRLPTPRPVTWDVLLEVRKALGEPLVAFRAAMSDLALSRAEDPSDAAFDEYVDHIWRSQAEPALHELDELVREARLRDVFFRDVSGDLSAYAGPLFALATAATGRVSDLVSAAIAAVTPALATLAHYRKRRLAVRSHDWFFLHEVGKRL